MALIPVTRAQMIDWLRWKLEECGTYAGIYTAKGRKESDLSEKVLEHKKYNEQLRAIYTRCVAVLKREQDATEYDVIWLMYVLGHTAVTLKYGTGSHVEGDALRHKITKKRDASLAEYEQAHGLAA